MATLKQRLHRKNSEGEYDSIHLETSSSVVLMDDGTTTLSSKISAMDTSIAGKLDSSGTAASATKLATARTIRTNLASTSTASFNGTANITPGVTGTLPVTNGGTGVTTLADLGNALINAGVVGAPDFIEAPKTAGIVCTLAGYTWIIVDVNNYTSDVTYLILKNIYKTTIFGSNNTYAGSILASVAADFEANILPNALAYAVDTTVNGVTAKIFVPSYEMCNGGFQWFNCNANRVVRIGDELNYSKLPWSTSSPGDSSTTNYSVSANGTLLSTSISSAGGFRPCIGLNLCKYI